ncbi:histone-lysine N-methyltransferase [Coprinopsis cinerea okayama7|uniref:Histone-lysine N-methyltransferase, H3 lysine-36 specific n=1 Tax=Coprinopsis cinerea (strain Okayama-7 / 130 / ATCC MYA-4618 / FGSC 9003) TaxID=240176 RepID=A8NJ83_COPC7|nr:histone-lysine N-methyltransferase [Coprinopsis cinerea okayama7\|eukprot:XP_001834167.2 histone-lysine N-methyltransferase [Coprinopsis cinerea okayama7\
MSAAATDNYPVSSDTLATDTNMALDTVQPGLEGEPMSVDVKPDLNLKTEDSLVPPSTSLADLDMKGEKSDSSSSLNGSPNESSKSSSPTATSSKPQKASTPGPQLIGDLPIAREDALKTFNEIPFNNYQFKSLGRSRESVLKTFAPCVDNEDNACGPYSDCINRLTQVECLPEDCRCRSHCQNQRFQKRQYANIEIVLTEKKGYGLRAEDDIPKDSFIYEYVGDVVSPNSFKKRMREYAEEGIQHFYFMMLQKDEFIDATKSGGIGRFANHSCNPNCYVAKWTVGDHVRMGIFSKRLIRKHEELTFNYNVDRYGHQAQTCYCGEPNCIGFIGGKTQTDVATMDDLYLDALGITDEDDVAALKGTKKKKGKKIDDPDFMPSVKPIVEKEVPKVVQAIRQTSNRKVLYKLLTRIKITDDQAALRQIMRLRGYSVMKNVLEDYVADLDLVELVLQCLESWPLLNRNKVDDSQIMTSVEGHATSERESLQALAKKLMEHWQSLPLYNRIPKRALPQDDGPSKDKPDTPTLDPYEEQIKRRRQEEEQKLRWVRIRAQQLEREKQQRQFREHQRGLVKDLYDPFPPQPQKPSVDTSSKMQEMLKAIIANATETVAAEEKRKAEEAEAKAKAEAAAAEKAARRKARAAAKKAMTPEEKEALKEKRLMKLIGAVVVKSMSKYARGLQKDYFKKYAKELTQVITEKEKKSSSYKEGRLESLSEEKVAKIKKFSKDYIAKVLRKLEKAGKYSSQSSRATTEQTGASSSTHTQTPNSLDGGDGSINGGGEVPMSVEEAMDMEEDSDVDADGSVAGDEEQRRAFRNGDGREDGSKTMK